LRQQRGEPDAASPRLNDAEVIGKYGDDEEPFSNIHAKQPRVSEQRRQQLSTLRAV
jgi:hypothetical protein